MSSARRSGRIKGPRAVYTDDPFEIAGLSDESSSEHVPESSKRRGKRRKSRKSSSDDEFVARGSDEDVDVRADDDEVSEADEIVDDGDAMEIEDSDFTPRRRARAPTSRAKAMRKRPAERIVVAPAEENRVRGILDPKDHVAKTMHYVMTFGADDRDLISSIYLRDRWFRGIDACLPSRVTLENYDQGPDYEFGPTFGVHPDDIERERTSGWDWYYDSDTGERFRKRQRIDKIKEADARRTYLPMPKKKKHTVLIGPADKQEPVRLGNHDIFNFGEPWRDVNARRSNQSAPSTVREGWLLSMSQKVQCMAWAPNQDGFTQYLAVVAPITAEQKKTYGPPEDEPLSPFKPSPPYPCALQLWEIKGKSAVSKTNTLDMNVKPRLRLTLCTEWGDLRRIAWCPMSRKLRDQDETSGAKSIGLLAGIWSDGKVRVLDVKIRKSSPKAEYVKVSSPVFEAGPSSSLCTCVTWLSPSDIAVGCSNGFVAIWSIVASSTAEPQPYLYHPIHTTYVTAITSAYPTNPHLLSTIGMDGDTRLWSMTDPRESVSTPRVRIASPVLSYSPVLFSVVSSDENNFGRLMPIRRFFGSVVVGRMPNTISSLAPCSFWHPSLLYGCSGGEVIATNPARRLLYSKEQQWQQLWFTHDWVQGPETDSPGISRFYDGYRAESQNLARNLMGEKRPMMGLTVSTIHDESTHVTALGWNPNRPCAAWASAALGCGLVRIEDLAI